MDKKCIVSIIFLLSLGIISACGPQSVPAKQKASDVSYGEMQIINELFTKNNITLENLNPTNIKTDGSGNRHIVFDQYYNDLLVTPGNTIYHFNKEGNLTSVSGKRIDVVDVSANPNLNEENAFAIAKPELIKLGSARFNKRAYETQLIYFSKIYYENNGVHNPKTKYTLAWLIKPQGKEEWPRVIVDAQNGSIIIKDSGIIVG